MRIFGRADERGAVAVFTAIMALLLIGIGALAVDLGNMYARKRMVQTQADLAAVAGAGKLPDAAAARAEAFDYLKKNLVWGDADPLSWSLGDFTDGDLQNGEIEVFDGNTKVRVTAPPATVDFGLANVLNFSSSTVHAQGTAAIRSLKGLVLPFFVPDGCGTGFRYIKSGSQPPEPSPVYETPQNNSAPTPERISPLEVPLGNPGNTRLEILGRDFTTESDPALRVAFVRGGQRFYDEVAPGDITEAPVISPPSRMDPDKMLVDIPPEVANTIGVWHVQLRDYPDTNWTPGNKTLQFTIANPASAPGCDQKATGDFGLLDSPRAKADGSGPMNQLQDRIQINIAKGLDHSIVPFPWRPTQSPNYPLPANTVADNCRTNPGNQPIAGGQLDEYPTREGANCMLIETGNKVDVTTDGLIFGGSADGGFEGRLDEPTNEGCSPDGDSDTMTVLGKSGINADTLACFLHPGVNIKQLIESDPNVEEELISSDIINSPRFFYVPVLNYTVNPPNGFYPVVTFLGAFITGEGVLSQNGAVVMTETNHGLETNTGGTKLDSLRVVAFPLTKLPSTIDKPGADTVEYIGVGPKTVRLIE